MLQTFIQMTTRMIAFRQQLINQQSLINIQATNYSNTDTNEMTYVQVSPSNFINSSIALESTFIVEAVEYAINPY